MTRRLIVPLASIAALSALALTVGCSTASTAQGETTVTRAEAPRPPCPLGVEGAQVYAEDTPDGVALTFTSADKTDALRARARDAAAMYGPRKAGAGHDGKHGQGGHHGLQPMQMPPAFASTEEIEGGMRVRLIPVEPGDADKLREKARDRVRAMSQACR